MAEYLDLFDAERRPLGSTMQRGKPVPPGTFAVVVQVLTVSREGKILVTKRAPEKKHAGQWEITGGAKRAGEPERTAVCRELREETGITAKPDELIFRCVTRCDQVLFAYYLFFSDRSETEPIALQAGETADAKWLTVREFLNLIVTNEYTGTEPGLLCSIYAGLLDGLPLGAPSFRYRRRERRLSEQLDLVDYRRRPTGQRITRGRPSPPDTYRMIVSILTLRPDGRLLITRRAPQKSYAGRWEISGGCVQAGESLRQAAVRELWEETGILCGTAQLEPRGYHRGRNVHFCYFLLRRDVPLSALRMQRGETDAAEFVTPAEFRKRMRENRTITAESLLICRHFPELFSAT
ncbi:MAG: NUDIX hydrolase [Oscillospiraceae bacterium]|nr:NUDIX hydrolase [Oscillospiraceae bacterium]